MTDTPTFTIPARIARETAKAILVAVELSNGAETITRKMWFPRSRTLIEGAALVVERWLGRAKIEEMFGTRAARCYEVYFDDAPQIAA